MRRIVLLLALCLAACAPTGSAERALSLSLGTSDAARQQELVQASIRVMERRLDRMGETLVRHTETAGNPATVTVATRSPEVFEALLAELTQPFTLAFMTQAAEGKGDIEVAGHGAFVASGFTEKDIDWTAVEAQADGKSRVLLQLTPEGRTKLESIYKANGGKYVGMFVRGKLVSKLLVDGSGLKDQIVIGDIPSEEFAATFSDDVNVGRYVTFSAAQ